MLKPGQTAALDVRVRGTAPGAAALQGSVVATTAMDPRADAPVVAAVPVSVSPPPPPPPPVTRPADVTRVRATRVTATVTRLPKRGLVTRIKVTGRLVLPGSAPANACAGQVRIRVRAGKRVILTKKVKLRGRRARCTFTVTVKPPPKAKRYVRAATRLRVETRFLGTARVVAKAGPVRNVAVRVAPPRRR